MQHIFVNHSFDYGCYAYCNYKTVNSIYRQVFNNRKGGRLRWEIMLGYGLPLIVCFLTAVTEFSAPRCAIYRPRFGEKTCFFTGNLAYILYTKRYNFFRS